MVSETQYQEEINGVYPPNIHNIWTQTHSLFSSSQDQISPFGSGISYDFDQLSLGHAGYDPLSYEPDNRRRHTDSDIFNSTHMSFQDYGLQDTHQYAASFSPTPTQLHMFPETQSLPDNLSPSPISPVLNWASDPNTSFFSHNNNDLALMTTMPDFAQNAPSFSPSDETQYSQGTPDSSQSSSSNSPVSPATRNPMVEKPANALRCDYCQKTFIGYYQRGNLRRHFKSCHSNAAITADRICRVCENPFKRSDARKKHEWRKHKLLSAEPTKKY